ncbi:MAG: response regulator [Elusimicrobia bacterium]|nr:response regulator [Elusimicrobiota bacterium]
MASNVLIVDDQANVRGIVRAFLETVHGCAVVEATDGLDAVARLAAAEFDLVISDLVMPRMTGLELLGHIRRDRKRRALPVVLLTSQGDEKERRKAQALGVSAYLLKPFDPKALQPLLERLLP